MKTFNLKVDPLTREEYYEVYLRGKQLLSDPVLNKGSCFTEEERVNLGLAGLLRWSVNNIDEQVSRAYENYASKKDNLERYIFLQGLLDRSETLFYRVLLDHLVEMMPIVYTPTVGEACQKLSHITRRYRGVYLSPDNIARIDRIFESLGQPEISLLVCTDGERILGLGDLGSDGMGIPVGKVNLYVAAGGLHPVCCVPVCLDVGTNNEFLLTDPMYLGWRNPRLSGPDYDRFIERFVLGVRRNFPTALLQWEDFGKGNAFRLLERYRERILSFNDDIQGTGAVALSAIITALRIKGERGADQRFAIAGMGQAGVGIARRIRDLLLDEGLTMEEAGERIFGVDAQGLLTSDMPDLEEQQRPFTQPRERVAGFKLESPGRIGLLDVVRNARATVIVGVTGRRGLFDDRLLSAMAVNTPRPVALVLSNPTSRSECTPEEMARATNGRGLLATGSPFGPVTHDGRTIRTSQCNNLYVFPGMGLGALVGEAMRITDRMFLVAARALSDLVTPELRAQGLLLPEMSDVRRVTHTVALAVAKEARDAGFARMMSDEELSAAIARAQWDPHYYPYRAG
jgi:malate dehydrogenase (oxaloacetate-decarboxylating)